MSAIWTLPISDARRPWIKRTDGGSTLFELLLALTILVVITSIAIPRLDSFTERNRSHEALAIARASLQAARQRAIDQGVVVRWAPNVICVPHARPVAELELQTQASAQYLPSGFRAELTPAFPITFKPNGMASDGRLTIYGERGEVGTFEIIGATGAVLLSQEDL